MFQTRQRFAMVIATLLASLLLITSLSSTASAATVGSATIKGTVTDPAGTRLAGIDVRALRFDAATQLWDTAAVVTTQADGSYQISGLATGSYQVEFVDWSAAYVGEFYDNATTLAEARSIALADGGAATANAELAFGSSPRVSGKVTDAQGNPLARVRVEAVSVSDTQRPQPAAVTGPSGNYQLMLPQAGSYRLRFFDETSTYAPAFYPGTMKAADSRLVAAAVGPIQTLDTVALSAGGALEGVVRDSSGRPLADVAVSVFDNTSGTWQPHNSTVIFDARTDSLGRYRVSGLAATEHRLSYSLTGYRSEFHADADNVTTATGVAVTAGQTTLVPAATLDAPASITGRVLTEGRPFAKAGVLLYRAGAADYIASLTTDPAGNFRFDNLAPGSYQVRWGDYTSTAPSIWCGDAYAQSGATVIELAGGQTRACTLNVNPYRRIKGRVTTANGEPRFGAQITAYAQDAKGTWVARAYTNAHTDGTFTLDSQLLPGSYRLQVGSSSTEWLDTFVGGNSLETARDISLRADADTVGVDVVLQPRAVTTPNTPATAVAKPVFTLPTPTTATTTPPAPPAVTPAVVGVTTRPQLSGKPKVGATLTVTPGAYSQPGAIVSYQWTANGKPIAKATKRALKLTASLRGKKVGVRVTATASGAAPVTLTLRGPRVR